VRGLAERIEALIGRPLGDDEPLAVAVSGGADSLALLLLARDAYGPRVRALTVDHGLRSDSRDEAAGVAALCAGLGVAHATLRWEGAKPAANVQAAAREARYGLMADWCRGEGVAWLATAHHADDQAETLLMRLARGAGLGGLAGVRSRRDLGGVTLLRPLLAARRRELAAVVAAAGLPAVDDPANRDDRYDRTRARRLLAADDWLDAERVAASAAHLADAEAALDWAAELAWRSRASVAMDRIELDAAGLPRELQRRLVRQAIAQLAGPAVLKGPDVDRLLDRLAAAGSGTLAGVRAQGGTIWRFLPAPPRRSGAPGS
jgi:tRNA(Ile)-lysidine synthase